MADWQVGDLALCVDDSIDRVTGARSLALGKIYCVTEVLVYINWGDWPSPVALKFAEIKSSTGWGWSETRFRKVTPPAADEFDRETIALMNGVKEPTNA